MFFNIIIKEYNINIINLNKLLNDNIETEIGNFLFDNNLSLKVNSRDLNKIILHYINNEIINNIKEDYNNILLFNFNNELKTLHNLYNEEDIKSILHKNIRKSIKMFNYSLFEIKTNFIIDKNVIYSLKCLAESKNNTNFKKLKEFCKKLELRSLSQRVKNNHILK